MGEVIKIDRGVDLYANKSEALEICEAIYLATCEFFEDEPRLTVPTSMTKYVQSRMQDLKDAGDNTSLIEYNAKITALVWNMVLRVYREKQGY